MILSPLHISFTSAQQNEDLEFTLDTTSSTVTLPNVFRPSMDLSGRGFHQKSSWPQAIAASEVLERWENEVGFNGLFRLQYNLWEINQLAKNKTLQDELLANYEKIIKKISDSGGVIILNIFGTPAGLGKVLDKKSAPLNLKAFKEWLKGYIKNLSCDKRYNIWYEVWSAPDLDDFFLGRKQEYLNLYRAIAEGIKELEQETKVHIPLGGPSTSWWFQNFDGNTVITSEESLIYDLIRFCYNHKLPLNFITWHGYSTDPKVEKEITTYRNKTPVALIRDWLSYFHFDRNIPLIVDEWNYDSGANVLAERHKEANVTASYILARLKNMYEAGIGYQLYFSLEDFQNNKEGIVRNVGVFWFNPEVSGNQDKPKSIYNVFRMLASLGSNIFSSSLKFNDEFVGAIATKLPDGIIVLMHNYIDPYIAINFLSRNIAGLKGAERKIVLNLIRSNKLNKILQKELDISKIRASNKIKTLLKKAEELNSQAIKFMHSPRNVKLVIKNLKDNYLYQRYTIDATCNLDCEFAPQEEKEIAISDIFQQGLELKPYSVQMLVLKKRPKQPESTFNETAPEVTKPVENTKKAEGN